MIPEILREIDGDSMLFLLNTILFDAEWQTPFPGSAIRDESFTAADGTQQSVQMMRGSAYRYLKTEGAVGFLKSYADGYSFAALLPDGDLESFLSSLTGEKLLSVWSNASVQKVRIGLPKFSYECSYALSGTLQRLGMTDAFSPILADFSALGSCPNGDNLFVEQVLHKTRIEVTESGTKAAAVTVIEVPTDTASMPEKTETVILNCPFLYAILDDATGLPVFLGCYTGSDA